MLLSRFSRSFAALALAVTLGLGSGVAPAQAEGENPRLDLDRIFAAGEDSLDRGAWSTALQLDRASGLPDPDVLDATWQANRLLVGTRSGLFAYDGLYWTELLDDGPIHWVATAGEQAFAGGDRGLWRADSVSESFRPVADAPDSIRCGILAPSVRGLGELARPSASELDAPVATSAAEVDRRSGAPDELLLGTTHGLYRGRPEGAWTSDLDSLRVSCLAATDRGRVYVGTFGQGLRWSDPSPDRWARDWNVVRNPWIGVSDSLPGDFIHDLKIDEAGELHLATSAYSVGPRYRIHENARLMGLIDEHRTHLYTGAAYARWNHQYWQVRHLYQHYRRSGSHGDQETALALEEDVDADGETELVFLLQPGRNLAPRALVCFDRDSGTLEWSHRLAGKPQLVLPVDSADGPEILFLTSASDHGARFDGQRDDTSTMYSIDARGRMRVLRQWPGRAGAGVWVLTRPGPEGPVPAGLYLRLTSLDPAAEQQVWFLDFATREWERAPLQDSIQLVPQQRALEDEGRHLAVTVEIVPEPVLQLRDLATGRPARAWPLPELLPGQSAYDGVQVQLRRVGGSWEILLCGEQQYCLIDAEQVRMGTLPDTGERVPRSWLKGPEGEPPLVVSRPRIGALRMWRPKPGRSALIRDAAPNYDQRTLSLPDDFELPVLEADDFELLLTYEPRSARLSLSSIRIVRGEEPDGGRILSVAPGSEHIGVFDFEGRLRRTLPLPEPLRMHPDLHWCSGARTWIEDLDHDLYLGPCHGMPYRMVRHDPLAERPVTVYDPELPFLDRGCVALLAVDPSHDLLGTERGLKRTRWDQQGDFDPWLLRRPVRGLEAEGGSLLAWGREGLGILAAGARCVDPEITDFLVGEKAVAWVRGSELSLRLSDGAPDATTRRWRLAPNRNDPDVDWRLHPSPRGVWAWHVPLDRSTVTLRHFGTDGEASHDLSEQTWHEGATRPISAAFDLEGSRWLLFADQGLVFADLAEGDRLFPVIDGRWSFRAAIETPEGWLAAGHRGELVEVRRTEAGFEAREQRRLPLAASDEVHQLVHTREGQFLIADSGIFHLGSDTAWEAPGGSSFVSAAPRHGGGLWVGTSQGLARLSLSSPEVIALSLPGLPAAPVHRILDEDGSTGRRLWILVDDRGLFRCDLPAPAGLRVHATRDSVSVALWPGAFSAPAAVEWHWRDEDRWRRAVTTRDSAGRTRFALATPPQGRRQLELRAFDSFGRAVTPASAPSFVWRLSSPAVQALLLLGLAGLAFAVRWRPRLPARMGHRLVTPAWVHRLDDAPWSAPFLLLALPLLLVIHFVLLIDVPWAASAAMGVAVVGMDAISRRRESRQRVDPERARAQLLDLLRQYHHRGGGIGPVDELVLTLQNLAALSDAGQDPIGVVRGLCAQLLEVTEPLRRDLTPLATDAGVDEWLIDRIQSPLHFLRERAHDCTSAPRESWPSVLEPRSRHSIIDAGHSFLGGIRTLHHALVDQEGCDATAVLENCVERYRRQAGGSVQIEWSGPDKPLPTPIPVHELEELLDNLVRNAFAALRETAAARLRFELTQRGDALRLRVEDNGPGIPEQVLPRLFEPGVSGSNGHGYGLARCHALVRSWGGSIVATNLQNGGGARFLVEVGRGEAVHGRGPRR